MGILQYVRSGLVKILQKENSDIKMARVIQGFSLVGLLLLSKVSQSDEQLFLYYDTKPCLIKTKCAAHYLTDLFTH